MNNPSFSSSALCIGLKKGLSALRSQLPAGACLWSMAICVWVLYYHVNSVTVTLNNLGELKKEASYLFAFVSVGLSGGLLPSAFMALMRLYKVPLDSPTNPRNRPKREVFLIAATSVMFGLYGVWIDFFYRLQGKVFGNGTDIKTVASKVAVDQLLFTPFLHVPMIQLSLLFISSSLNCFAFTRTVKDRRMFSSHQLLSNWWLPALLPTWLVWCPAVCVVYSLPASLQLCIFALVMTFWAMIQIFVGDSSASAATDRDQSEHQGEALSSSSSGDDDNGRKHAKKDQSLPLSPGDVITVIATVGTGGDDRGAREGHRGAGSAGGGGGGDGGVCIPGASL